MTNIIRFQPTLFIFMGTSSGQIGWRLKKMLRDAYGDIPILRFLWIDIDSDIDPLAQPYFSREERAELAGFDPAEVLKNINYFPTIKDWMPESVRIKPGMLAGGGAPQQMRLVGRLALFRKFTDATRGPSIYSKLQKETAALFEIDKWEQTRTKSNEECQFVVEEGCRVILVFSPCGGTGSSMSFDIAYLCRHLLKGHQPTVISVSIMPPVVDKAIKEEAAAQKQKIRANAYAWFKEDNYLSENPRWNISYPGGITLDEAAPPFEIRFVVDMTNQAGYRLNSADDVYKMIAQAIFMDTGSSIGGAMRGFNKNVHVLGELFQGALQSYSSLAAASLVYPKERLGAYCGTRLACKLLREGLLGEPKEQEVMVAVNDLLSHLRLRDELRTDLVGITRIRMQYEANILKAGDVNTADAAIRTQETQNEAAREAAKRQVQENGKKLLADLTSRLEQEIVRIAAMKGVKFALTVIQRLQDAATGGMADMQATSLSGLAARLISTGRSETELKKWKDELQNDLVALKKLDDDPLDAIERKINAKGWNKKFSLFTRECVQDMTEINNITLQVEAQNQARAIYDQLAGLLGGLQTRLGSCETQIGQIARDLEPQYLKMGGKLEAAASGYELLREIEMDFSAYYQEHASHINPATAFQTMIPLQASKNLEAFSTWIGDNLAREVVSHSASFFKETLEKTSLLTMLQDLALKQGKNPQKYIEQQLESLIAYCHPFWVYYKDRGLDDLEGHSIIGVEDEDTPLLPETYRGSGLYEVKTTGFRDRIDVVRVQHGMPAFLLQGMEEYRVVYEEKRKGMDPLHILPGMEDAPDLLPQEGKANFEMFAVAFAFGYIVQASTWFYYDPEKEKKLKNISPDKKFRLAQGRGKAAVEFSKKEAWVRAVEEKVNVEIGDMGNLKAKELLDQWIADLEALLAQTKADDISRKQYQEEIKAIRAYKSRL